MKFVEDYGVKLFLTGHGYFKKISLVSLRSSGDQKLKEDDTIVSVVETQQQGRAVIFQRPAECV